MALLRYERDFRKKLEQREINPSAESWNKLQDKLDQEHQRNQKYRKNYIWIGAAASIIASILVFNFYFKEEVVQYPAVVNSPAIQEETEPPMKDIPVVSEEEIEVMSAEKKKKKEHTEKPLLQQYHLEQEVVMKAEEIEPTSVISDEPVLKEVISDAVIVNATEAEESVVTDAEVDALLQDALTELELEQNSEEVTLTARDLLWETEIEMEHSLSKKVLELLKGGYIKTKTAVVERDF